MYSLHDITSRCVKIEKPEPTYNRESPQGSSVHGLSAVKVEKRDTSCNLQIHQVMSGNEVVIQDGIPTRGEMLSMPMNTLQEMQEEMSASEMDIRLGELSSNQAQRKYSYEVDTQDVMPVYQIGSYEQVSIDQIGTQEDMSTDRMVTQKELPQMTTGDGECRNLTYPYKGRSPNQTRDSERQLSHQIGVHAEVSTYKRRSQDGLPLYQVSGAQEMPPYLLGTQGNMASHQIGVQGGMSGYQAITQKRLSPRQIGSEQEQSNHQMGTQAKISNHQIGAQEGMSGFQVASDEGIATRPDGLSTPKIGTHRRMSGYHMGTQEEMTSHHMGSPETRQMGSQEGIPAQQISIQDVMSAKQMVSQNGLSTRQGSAFLETSGFQLDIEDGMLIHQKGPQNGLSAKQMASPNGLSTSQVGAHPEMPAYPFGMQDRMLSHQMSAQNGMSVKQMVSPNGLSTNKVDAHPEISGFHLGMQDGIPSHQMSPQNGLSARQMGSQNGMSAHQIGAHPEMSGYQLNIQDGMSTHQMGSQNGKSSRQIDTKGRLPRYQMGPYGAMPAYQRLSHERMPPYPTANYDKISTYKTELHESGTHERMQFQEMNYLGSMATPRSSTHSCHCSCHSPSQPQLSHFPAFGEENQRPSVIMVPFTKSKPVLGSPQLYSQVDFSGLNVHRDDQRLGFNGPQHNGNDMEFSDDSDSSDGGDNERSQEKYFRRTIDGTTAKFKLSKEEWKRIPINTFPSGGRLLSGDWTRIFLSKVKESNPWCSLRFKNNHVRSENSRKIHSAVFFRGGAECKRPECNVKVRFVIRKEKGKYVDVTYVGNVCHNSQPGGSDVTTDRRRNKRGRRPRPSSA